ncbi:hypothetical protein [Jeotgalibacillus salarius]|uniref:Uncharacterized protein n=1 Tax=Jeotgalibacillus salarius TaxID=546023 RepID=A0A4Y8LGZ8_9BACL|nr:hypothetical protein [Jeotgalibacillus salarius]TFD99802.1 hypothetical protein E2626_13555 [Jeotgalibacillus salarius]
MTDEFVLGFVIASAPKSLLPDTEFDDVHVFTAAELEQHFGIKGSLHFDRGEDNLLAGHGKAGFAYWTKLFALNEEELEVADWNHDIALHILIEKVKKFVQDNDLTVAKWNSFDKKFDITEPWCVKLFTPTAPPMLFKLGINDMKWLASLEMEFGFSAQDERWMELVKERAREGF